jgi:predicted nucleic acid-binding protein
MPVASLIDTNVLVYRVDPRFPEKQRIARDLLRTGLAEETVALPHQAILEFVAVATRPRRDLNGASLLTPPQAFQEADELLRQFPVLYPDEEVLSTALRGAAAYRLSLFDAHLWAYAEVNGLPEILSEDFAHGRHYGAVRVTNPFLPTANSIHELPPMYDL